MLVSLIITIFKTENYIERCIRSVVNQTYTDVEVIIVDDCTPDASIDIVCSVLEQNPEWQSRVKFVRNQNNLGIGATRWEGLKAASGDYVVYLDGDDYIAPDFLEKLAASALQNDSDMVICDFWYDCDGELIRNGSEANTDTSECVRQLLTGEIQNTLWNKLVRRRLFTEHDIHTEMGMNFLEDKSVIFRLAYFSKVISYIPEPLYYYNRSNLNALSRTSKLNTVKAHADMYRICNEFFSTNESNSVIDSGRAILQARLKGMLLIYGSKEERTRFLPLVGEVNLSTIVKKDLKSYYRLAIWLAQHNMGWAVKVMSFVIKNVYRLTRN